MKNKRVCLLQCIAVLAVLAFLALVVPAQASSDQCRVAFGGRGGEKDIKATDAAAVSAAPQEIVDFIPKNVELKAVRFERDTLPSEITSEKDPRFKKGLINLLKMVTDTVFVNSKKEAQKGELHLAKMLDNGQSLEFEYVRDERGGESVFRLSKVVLFKPNGQEITIDKTPVTDEGEFLNKKSVILAEKTVQRDDGVSKQIQALEKDMLESWMKDNAALKELLKLNKKGVDVIDSLREGLPQLAEGDRQKTSAMLEKMSVVQVPVVIKGPLLAKLTTWLDRVPFLSRQEMRSSLDRDALGRLTWKARARYGVKLMVDVTRKQTSKFILIGSVFLAYSQMDAITSYFDRVDVRPVSKSEEVVRVTPMLEAEGQLMTDVLKIFSGQPSSDGVLLEKIQARTQASAQPRDAIADYARYEALVSQLLAAEPGGGAIFYLGDAGFKKLESFNSLTATREASRVRVEAGYMLAQFPTQKKILLTSVLQSGGAGLPTVSTLVIEQAVNPITYAAMEQSLVRISNAGTPIK